MEAAVTTTGSAPAFSPATALLERSTSGGARGVTQSVGALERRVAGLCGEARVMEMASAVRAVGFDMDGVLFGTQMSAAVRNVGIGASLRFMWSTWKLPNREDFFASLRVPQLERDTGGMEVHHQGNALPSLLTAWQCGLVAGAQAEADIAAYYYSAECPLSPDEVSMFLNIAHLMLHPETFVSTRVPLVRGVELLEKVAAQHPHALLFGLTNWDSTSFTLLKARYPELFARLAVVVVSGDVKAVKPHPRMFEMMLSALRQRPGFADVTYADVLLLDDELANVRGAAAVGMHTHLWNDKEDD